MKKLFSSFLLIAVLASCSSDDERSDLQTGSWTLENAYVDGEFVDLSEYGLYTVIFEPDRIRGYDGCNWIGGIYEINGEFLDVTELGATKRLCFYVQGYVALQPEHTYHLDLSEGTLKITSPSGDEAYVFAPTNYDIEFGSAPY
ncbi:MAG TPA: META domain-containing protein [bacterium]|nr:META domain-containing protein [bacterium]